jgi:Flp pilus assembly pilin Flp
MLKRLLSDEVGAIISAELVMVMTILVIGVIAGLTEVALAVNAELNDVGNAIGAMDQSYMYTGFRSSQLAKIKSAVAGSRWSDGIDFCDTNTSFDMVCGPPVLDTCG